MFTQIQLQQFRCLSTALSPSPTVNIICGDNGSGKSSILEAIHYLAYGRSFRTAIPGNMIQYEAPYCAIHADIGFEDVVNRVGLMRSDDGLSVKLNNDTATLSKISKMLPCVFIDSHSHRAFFSAKSTRRTFFDWLTFHVKHHHMLYVRKYSKVLQARNAALKKGYDQSPWDAGLAECAEHIHAARQDACDMVSPVFSEIAASFGYSNVVLEYDPGYSITKGLLMHLRLSLMIDQAAGRTSVGPHACHWKITCRGNDVGDGFSQGQQKMLYFALVCAKHTVMRSQGLSPIFLMDDFAAELDKDHRQKVSNWFSKIGGQCFVTAIHPESVSDLGSGGVFHVEQGGVSCD